MWNLEFWQQKIGFAVGEPSPHDYPQIPNNVVWRAYIRTALTAGVIYAAGKVMKLW